MITVRISEGVADDIAARLLDEPPFDRIEGAGLVELSAAEAEHLLDDAVHQSELEHSFGMVTAYRSLARKLRAAGVQHSAGYARARTFDPQAAPRTPRPAPAPTPEPEGSADLFDRIRLADVPKVRARLAELGATATTVTYRGSTADVRAFGLTREAAHAAAREL